MNILLVGSGGREHALAWALSASPLLTKLYCAPGNAGIAEIAECVPIPANDFDALLDFAKSRRIDFAVIAADAQLVAGLWDRFEAGGIRALGPSKAAAVLVRRISRSRGKSAVGLGILKQRGANAVQVAKNVRARWLQSRLKNGS